MTGMSLIQPRWVFLRLFLPMAALVVAGILVMGRSDIEREFERIRSLETLQVGLGAGALSRSLESFSQDLNFLAHHSALRNAVEAPTASNLRHLAEDFTIFSGSKGVFDQVRWIDETGMERVRVDQVMGKPLVVPKNLLQNKGKRYFFTDAIKLHPGEVFVSPLDLNVEQDKIQLPHKPMLRIATPITDGHQKRRGIVILNVFGQVLLDAFSLATSASSDRIAVANGEGYWLKSPNPGDEWGFMFQRPQLSMAARFPSVWSRIRATERGQELLSDGLWTWQAIHPLVVGQKSSTGSALPFSSSQREIEAKEYVWLSVSHLSMEAWSATRRAVLGKLYLMGVLVVGVLGFASWKLAHAWSGLALAEDALRRLNSDLERQVNDRTCELSRKVFELGEEVRERQRAEEEKGHLHAQLQQTRKMESLGGLAGGIAHDMNNVLGAILGLASAHIGTQSVGTPAHRAFQTIIKAAERGGKTVRSLLNFARKSPVEARELDLNAILREEVGLLERTTLSRVCLNLELAPDLQPIQGDASALSHAFMNLCVNAVDAMAEHAALTLRTRNGSEGWVEVQVEDNGVGMSAEVLEKAMDPYFTTKDIGKGTGLGLSMVYTTVTAHQGRMEIHSRPGEGTCVKMWFPAVESVVQPAGLAAEPAPEASPRSLTVLLVDDDELILSALLSLVEVLGHEAVLASSGEDALGLLAEGLHPDAIVLDMNMPGLGGGGTLPLLRKRFPDVPVFLATGRADQNAIDLADSYSLVSLLPKPFGMKEFKNLLEDIRRG